MNLNKLSLKLTSFLTPELSSKLSLTSLKALYDINLLEPFFATNQEINEPFKLLNLSFPNRIGVAAGMDKNADYFHVLEALGLDLLRLVQLLSNLKGETLSQEFINLIKKKVLLIHLVLIMWV